MDEVETYLAKKRMTKWPSEWKAFVASLPEGEARLFIEAAALLNARPHEDGKAAE